MTGVDKEALEKARNDLPKIVGVAIRHRGVVCALPRPARHHHVIRAIVAATGDVVGGDSEQGFVTSDGRFLGRISARALAQDNRQTTAFQSPSHLFSEDLW